MDLAVLLVVCLLCADLSSRLVTFLPLASRVLAAVLSHLLFLCLVTTLISRGLLYQRISPSPNQLHNSFLVQHTCLPAIVHHEHFCEYEAKAFHVHAIHSTASTVLLYTLICLLQV